MQEIPPDNPKFSVARDIFKYVFDPKQKLQDVLFLRKDYQPDIEALRQIEDRFPLEDKHDTLESMLLERLDAKEGEIVVVRNLPPIHKKPKVEDVYVKLRNSGFSSSRVVGIDELLDLRRYAKEYAHRHAFRILSLRDTYREGIVKIMDDMVAAAPRKKKK